MEKSLVPALVLVHLDDPQCTSCFQHHEADSDPIGDDFSQDDVGLQPQHEDEGEQDEDAADDVDDCVVGLLVGHCLACEVVPQQLCEGQHGEDDAFAGERVSGQWVGGVFVGEEGDGDEEVDEHEEGVVVVEGEERHSHDRGDGQVLPELVLQPIALLLILPRVHLNYKPI